MSLQPSEVVVRQIKDILQPHAKQRTRSFTNVLFNFCHHRLDFSSKRIWCSTAHFFGFCTTMLRHCQIYDWRRNSREETVTKSHSVQKAVRNVLISCFWCHILVKFCHGLAHIFPTEHNSSSVSEIRLSVRPEQRWNSTRICYLPFAFLSFSMTPIRHITEAHSVSLQQDADDTPLFISFYHQLPFKLTLRIADLPCFFTILVRM